MRKIGIQMSLLMGTALSFFLSLTGLLSAGQFTLPAFCINFAVSFVISMIIGLLVPMKKVTDRLDDRLGIRPRTLAARCLDALVSDLIYTPIITFCMVTLAWRNAVSHGAQIPYVPMLLRSMLISLCVGYVLIWIFMPLFMKLIIKKNGVGAPNHQGTEERK